MAAVVDLAPPAGFDDRRCGWLDDDGRPRHALPGDERFPVEQGSLVPRAAGIHVDGFHRRRLPAGVRCVCWRLDVHVGAADGFDRYRFDDEPAILGDEPEPLAMQRLEFRQHLRAGRNIDEQARVRALVTQVRLRDDIDALARHTLLDDLEGSFVGQRLPVPGEQGLCGVRIEFDAQLRFSQVADLGESHAVGR